MAAKYSHGAWEQFADQASTILDTKKFELFSVCPNSARYAWRPAETHSCALLKGGPYTYVRCPLMEGSLLSLIGCFPCFSVFKVPLTYH